MRGLLDGSLTPSARPAAMDHLRSCVACRQVYDGMARAEHAVTGGGGVLGNAALDRVADRLAASGVLAPAPAPAAALRLRWAAAAAAAALAVIATVVVLPLVSRPDEFTARGGSEGASIGIRVFRLGEAGAEELRDGATIRRGDRLGASYSSGDHAAVQWTVDAGGVRALLPELDSAALVRGAIDEPLEAEARVDGRFPAGAVTVTATFRGGAGGDVSRSVRLEVQP